MSASVDKIRALKVRAPEIEDRCIDLACEIAEAMETTSLGLATVVGNVAGGVGLLWTHKGCNVELDINPKWGE